MSKLRNCTAVVSLAATIGCQTWRPVRLTENPDPSTRPSVIEVTRKDGRQSTVYEPRISGDSLFGWYDAGRRSRASMALSEIDHAKARQVSGPRTAALVTGAVIGAGALFVIWFAIVFQSIE